MQIFLKEFLPINKDRNHVSSAFYYSGAAKGSIACLISIKSNSELDASNVARFIWNAVLDEYNYYGTEEGKSGDILESLKSAIGVADDKLLQLIKNDKESEEAGVELDLALVVLHEATLYFGVYEEQKINVLHNGELINITEILKQNGVKAGSSNIGQEDIVILSANETLGPLLSNLQSEITPEVFLSSVNLLKKDLTEGEGLFLISPKDYFSMTVGEELISESEEPVVKADMETDLPEASEEEELINGGDVRDTDETEEIMDDKQEEELETKGQIEKVDIKAKASSALNTLKKHSLTAASFANKKLVPLKDRGSKAIPSLAQFVQSRYGRNPKVKRFLARLTQSRISSPTMKGIKISGYKESSLRKKRFALLGGALLIILIGVFAINKVQNYRDSKAVSEQFVASEAKVRDFLDEAELKLRSDSSAAELALFNAEKAFEEMNIAYDQLGEEDQKKYDQLESSLQTVSDKISKTTPLSEEAGNIELFVDGRIDFGQNSNTGDIAMFQNTYLEEHLYVTDRGRKSVYRISTQTGEAAPLPGSDKLEAPMFIDIGVEGVYVYDLTKGVLKSAFGENNADFEPLTAINGLSSEAFDSTEVNDFAIFTSVDNVYVLSAETSSLYKASRTDAGTYALPSVYLTESKLSQAKDIFADFSIYILTGGSTGLNRYTFDYSSGQLASDPATITGLKEEFQNLTAGYTGSTLDKKLYVFDEDQRRVLLFEKPDPNQNIHPGELLLVKQYEYRGSKEGVFGNVKDIVVDSAEQFMYILDGNTIWRVTL